MDSKTFREFASDRILQAIIEINHECYPSFPVKMPAFCYLTFNAEGISINEVEPLFNKKKKAVMTTLPYTQLQKIEIRPVKKVTGVVFGLGFRINLDLKLLLRDGTELQFECEAINLVVALSEVLSSHQTILVDTFDLVDLFREAQSPQEAYDYLANHIDKLAAQKHVEVLRLTQTKHTNNV